MKQRLFIASSFLLMVLTGESFAFDVSTQFTEGDDSSFSLAPEAPISSSVPNKVAIVDKSGLHYSDPIAAMKDIATWCGVPSETNPCLIRIMPGIYNLGTNRLIMRSYVDVEGSGENATKIRGRGPEGVVRAHGGSEIRFLTVEHTGGVWRSVAVWGDQDASSQKLTNMTIISRNGTGTNYGIYYVMMFDTPPPTPPLVLRNVTVIASGGQKSIGIEHEYAGGIIDIYRSSIKGETYSVGNYAGRTYVYNTVLNGSAGGPGIFVCWHVYDKDYKFYENTCP